MANLNDLFPTIGLEIHVELKTNSKIFCDCKNDPNEKTPNLNICPICMAFPGTIPKLNKKALDHIVRVGYALGGEVADFSEFDRKHYFYPDIPKGYQISQKDHPFVSGGSLAGVEITRVHLEEDTGKIQHNDIDNTSLINFNRAGVPLMELVTEPVIKNAKEAVNFAYELQLLLQTLGSSNARLEIGEMRVEANISISDKRAKGTKVEIKNLNSFKAVEDSIDYEIERQSKLINEKKEILQETRGWNENKEITFSQRKKESAEEYRYFPDPDLPKLKLSEIDEYNSEKILSSLPELPIPKRKKYLEVYMLDKTIAEIFIKDLQLANLFNKTINLCVDYKWVSNILTSQCAVYIEENRENFFKNVTPENLNDIYEYNISNKLSSRGVKDVLKNIFYKGTNVVTVVNDLNILQNSNEKELEKIAEKVVIENKEIVEEYKNGKDKLLNFLVGKMMQASNGSANPTISATILKKVIKNLYVNMGKINGFTLLELLVVISIIGVLAVAVVVSLSGSTNAAEDAVRKQTLQNLGSLAEGYFYSSKGGGFTKAEGLCLEDQFKKVDRKYNTSVDMLFPSNL